MKKIVCICMALVLSLGIFAGCGGASSSSVAASSTQTSSEAPAQTVTITAWFFPTMQAKGYEPGAYEAELVKAFNDSQSAVNVKLEMIDFQNGPEKITASIAGGTAPDIIFDAPGRIIEWGKAGELADLNDMFTDDFKKDLISEQLLSACSDGENYYMYPISSAPFTMALNKTILEEEGLLDMAPTEGERTWTTDEFTALAKELAKRGYKGAEIYCGGQGGDQGTRAFITNLYGASITAPDLSAYTMDTPEAIKGVEYVLNGVKEGWLEPNTAGVANDALDHFDQGLVSATVLWGPGLASQRDNNLKATGMEALSVCLPSDDGVPELEYLVNGFCVFDNNDESKIEASKEFLRFLCDDPTWGPKNIVATGCFPVRASMGDLYPGDAEMSYYASLTKYYSHYYNTIDGYASMRPLWWGSLQAVLTEEKTPEDAMKAYTEQANQTIEEG